MKWSPALALTLGLFLGLPALAQQEQNSQKESKPSQSTNNQQSLPPVNSDSISNKDQVNPNLSPPKGNRPGSRTTGLTTNSNRFHSPTRANKGLNNPIFQQPQRTSGPRNFPVPNGQLGTTRTLPTQSLGHQNNFSSGRGFQGSLSNRNLPFPNQQVAPFSNSRRKIHLDVLRFNPMTAPERQMMHEDVSVFVHLLSKKVPFSRQNQAMGIPYQQFHGTNSAVYLDSGLIFNFHVNFPLHPTHSQPELSSDPNSVKSEWELAREQLRNSRRNTPATTNSFGNISGNRQRQPSFDKHQIAILKQAIKDTLKNAHNIRGLKPGDKVTVFLTGPVSQFKKSVLVAVSTYEKIAAPDANESILLPGVKNTKMSEPKFNSYLMDLADPHLLQRTLR